MTEAERRLWYWLRAHRFNKVGFRRQKPIGPYTVDFVAPEVRLVIEIDGGQHDHSTSDRRRDAWLGSKGYRVLRFWNSEILKNRDEEGEVGPRNGPGGGSTAAKAPTDSLAQSSSRKIVSPQYDGGGTAPLVLVTSASFQ